jgi:hypothetical protein
LAAVARAEEVRVAREGPFLVASIRVDDCRVALEHQSKWHQLRYRNACPQALAEKARLLAKLVEGLTDGAGIPPDTRFLAIGRLIRFPELAEGLALAAHASTDWDGGRGRPRSARAQEFGAVNSFVGGLLREQGLLRPLIEPLTEGGIEIAAVSVEKVLIGQPEQIPFGDRLLGKGVTADERLPFDAQVWLQLRRGDDDQQ